MFRQITHVCKDSLAQENVQIKCSEFLKCLIQRVHTRPVLFALDIEKEDFEVPLFYFQHYHSQIPKSSNLAENQHSHCSSNNLYITKRQHTPPKHYSEYYAFNKNILYAKTITGFHPISFGYF